jgi:glycosyltransferase involved in cell wall biosynthesis
MLAPEPETDVEPGPRPTFSVVIAAYNAASTIGAAIESALGQTEVPFEIVVCDDGSTDDIESALTPYRKSVVLVRKENGGGASALNAAIGAATGDFVSILDADDLYEPRRIEALGDLAVVRPDLDILGTDAYLEAGGTIRGRFSTWTPFAIEDQRTAMFERLFAPWPAVRRSRVAASGGYDETFRIAYDWDCYLRLTLAGARAGMIDVPLYRYRIGEGSLETDRPASLRERVLMLEKAARNPDLRPEELAPLQRAIGRRRRSALLAEAEAALRNRNEDARAKAFRVAVGRGMGARTRLKACLAVLAPRWAGSRLEEREEQTGKSRLARSHPR